MVDWLKWQEERKTRHCGGLAPDLGRQSRFVEKKRVCRISKMAKESSLVGSKRAQRRKTRAPGERKGMYKMQS